MHNNTTEKQIEGNHYINMAIQPWELIERNGYDFFEGSALAYIMRWRAKDGVIDLDKAIHCLEHIKELALKGHYGEQFVTTTTERKADETNQTGRGTSPERKNPGDHQVQVNRRAGPVRRSVQSGQQSKGLGKDTAKADQTGEAEYGGPTYPIHTGFREAWEAAERRAGNTKRTKS